MRRLANRGVEFFRGFEKIRAGGLAGREFVGDGADLALLHENGNLGSDHEPDCVLKVGGGAPRAVLARHPNEFFLHIRLLKVVS